MKIAVIGTGISGLGAAYLLAQDHDITVYEKNSYIGGHSRTIDINIDGKQISSDTGFIVYNRENYPNLTALFEHLDVPVQKSDMSFGVSIHNGWMEYGSKSIFAQKKNLLRPAFWRMVFDILKFNKKAESYIESDLTLGECINELGLGDWFKEYYLLAMGASIWSCSVETMLEFPASTFIRFFKNHGLLTVNQHPQWYTVSGGSKNYVSKLINSYKENIRLNSGVKRVSRHENKVVIEDETGGVAEYDQVVFACHADQAIRMIENPTEDEKKILGAFTYQRNDIVVHSDLTFMPKNKDSWASWIYLSEQKEDQKDVVSLSYWMNNLQGIGGDIPVIETLNPERMPDKDKIYDQHVFSHPVFTKEAVVAQKQIMEIQGVDKFWFCGAYQRYGFHEDGLWSAVRIAKAMGSSIPWNS